LEAFTRLLKSLPKDTGMAFVLLQHLDPQHESALTELLRRTTAMPVQEVTHLLRVEPNQVYVIPPNKRMEIKQGVLELEPRGKHASGEQQLINAFLVSLAHDQCEHAIGVVLSGTASDGTLGLEAIKSEGGITFAQDKSAKFDSMPRSAVDAGFVDFVLSPDRIAQELARIARHPLVASGLKDSAGLQPEKEREADQHESPDAPLASGGHGQPDIGASGARAETHNRATPRPEDESFKKILLMLHRHCGVDFSFYKSNTIQRRIARRMVLNHKKGPGDYAVFLKGNVKELDALYSDVLISVTSFFRNPEAFEILKRKIFPSLLLARRKSKSPIRIWTLGCSTGQEAYSIVMAYTEFAENNFRAPQLQVFATDLNEALLEKARHGLYAKSLSQDLSTERLRRFFVEEQGGYRINKTIREQVVFARQNALSDPPFSRMDLISCRNLLIYFGAELQNKIIPAFHYALNPGGFLFLGTSESVGQFTHLFAPADKKQRIFSRKAAPLSPLRLAQSDGRARNPVGKRRPRTTAERRNIPAGRTEPSAQREADRLSVSLFSPPGVLIDAELNVLQFRGATGIFLEPPSGKASFNLLKMAREGLTHPLRAAINLAKKDLKPVCRKAVRIHSEGSTHVVDVQVIPLKNLRERYYLVLFEDETTNSLYRGSPLPKTETDRPPEKTALVRRVRELEGELSGNRDYTHSIQEQFDSSTEELQASSEEAQSANEELQSINEELETSKEEIESSNEELITVNEEMLHRNEELKQLNSDLNNLHVSIDTGILVVGRNLTIRRFTVRAEKIFNLLPGDIGRPLSGIRHNLDFVDLEEFVQKVIDTVSFQQVEIRDKEGHWYSLRVRPYITDDGKIDGAVLVFVDIDALKETERGLRLSDARYQTLFNLGPVAVYTCDVSGSIREYNLRAAELWGRRPKIGASGEAFCGSFKMYTPDGRFIPHGDCPMADVLKGRVAGKFEGDVEIERPDGSRITVHIHIAPFLDDQGVITGAINSFIDITERNRTDVALRETVARLRFMAESMPQKIFTASATGEVDYLNRQWLEFTGLTFEQLKGWGWKQVIHPEESEENMRLWKRAIGSGEDIQLDHRIRGRDGVYRWHLSRARAMRDPAGRVLMWIGSDTDVDDARRTMEEVARSDQAKDEFIAVMSHELRTPLTPVLLIAAELRNNQTLPLEIREQLADIERNVALEARLIDDLLDITKIAHGKLLFRAEECDAHVLINAAIEIAREEAIAKGIAIKRNLSAKRSRLMADPTRFQQVIWNLVRNAVKFTPWGGNVAVGTSEIMLADGKPGLRIEITDTGIGIAANDLERIFAPFDQAGHSGDQKFGGVGLGLTIARAVVGLHGGMITARSGGLNCGATFVVELPGLIGSTASFPVDSLRSSTLPVLRSAAIRPQRLLLVDDHASTLQALVSILRRDGHHVVTATTIAAALAAASANQLDLVISDVGLPDGSGIEMMEELRSRYKLRGIALSGYGTEADIARAHLAGFVTHLVKPVTAAELRRAILSLAPSKS
jgi:PAS domain S-box-containing protein